jgi:hypothetical protein
VDSLIFVGINFRGLAENVIFFDLFHRFVTCQWSAQPSILTPGMQIFVDWRKMWYSLTFYFVVFFTCQWSAQPFSLKVCMHNSIWLILRYSLKPGQGSSWSWLYGSWIYNYQYLCNQCLSPLMLWVRISIMARCTSLCDKVCQWPPTGRWFSPGPPVSFVNKTDCHDITEILLKVALNIIKQ